MATRIGLTGFAAITLTAIASAVLANPASYNQNEIVADYEAEQKSGCIAYHYSKLKATDRALKLRLNKSKAHNSTDREGYDYEENPFFVAAKKDLKLTDDQATRLMGHTEHWPKEFGDAYDEAKTAKGRARVLYNRILFFVKSDGTDIKVDGRSKAARIKSGRSTEGQAPMSSSSASDVESGLASLDADC